MTFEDFLLCCLTFYRTTNQWIKTKIKLINWQWNWLSVAAMENIFFMHVDYFLVFSPTENTFNHPFLWWNKIMAFFKNTTKVLSLFKNHFFFFWLPEGSKHQRCFFSLCRLGMCVSVFEQLWQAECQCKFSTYVFSSNIVSDFFLRAQGGHTISTS